MHICMLQGCALFRGEWWVWEARLKPLSRRNRVDGERLGSSQLGEMLRIPKKQLVAVGWGGSALILLQRLLSSFPIALLVWAALVCRN